MISVRLQGKPFNITVIQALTPTSNVEEAEVERFYEDLQDLLERTPKKDVLFIIGDWNTKVGSQEIHTWSNRQIWPYSTKRSRSKANRVLPRKCTGHSKHPLPQHKRRLYTWTSPDGQHRNQIDYILCSQRWRSSIQSTKTRPGADCGSDHELLIVKTRLGAECGSNHELLVVKFRLKLKKAGKTTRPFRYDLNQIPYDYTVEVKNRFKGIRSDRVP